MKRYLPLCLLLLTALAALSPATAQQRQKITLESFELDPFDRTAQNERYRRIDGNEKPMAIIKVSSNTPNDNLRSYSFDFGNISHYVDSTDHDDGTLWVYVSRNAKLVTIRRQGYTTISKRDLGLTVEAGKTYTMVLSAEVRRVRYQMVQFAIVPPVAGATVAVKNDSPNADFEKFGDADENGNASKSLPLGHYTYKVLADDYVTATGSFELRNEKTIHTENVLLKPNFAEVTVTAQPDAEIYIDGNLMGKTEWKGRLKAGNHQAETRLSNHTPAYTPLTVSTDGPFAFQLQPPVPITGSLSVATSPAGAVIFVDNKEYGQSPRIISDLLIGKHQVTLAKPGYIPQKHTVEIKEGETFRLEGITLEGLDKPKEEKKPKKPEPKVESKQNPKVKSEPKPKTAKGEAKSLPTTAFYVQAGAQVGSLMVATGTLGAYLGGFNIEATYGLGLAKSETIYWNHTTDPDVVSTTCTYKPTLLGVKLGYGMAAGSSLRLTPQVGLTVVNISASEATSKGNATAVALGLRGELYLGSHFALYAAPEFDIPVSQSDTFKRLEEVSTKIKGWKGGFNIRAGISISF